MITLAIECATKTAAIALLDLSGTLAEIYLRTGAGHAEVLLPALESLFSLTGYTMERVDLLVCTTGPGSFTGVRTGISTIKGLALATGKPVIGVSTLEAIAMNALPSRRLICPLLDAGKNNVYAGLYRIDQDGFPKSVARERLTDIVSLVRSLASETVDFVGEAAVLHQKRIREDVVQGAVLPADPFGRLTARSVGMIGLRRYRQGLSQDPLTLFPNYLRLSDAENQGMHPVGDAASFQI